MWTQRLNRLLLLATFLSTSTCEEPCTPEFKPNFNDVVQLTYNFGNGVVNRMVVKLADGQPFVEMFTDSCRDLSKIKIRVDYRNVEDQDWTQFVGRRGTIPLDRAKVEIRKTILPCAQYEVKIVAILEDDTEIDSEILNFGPFYKVLDEDTIKADLTEESMHDIADTISYSNISSAGFTVSWGDICAQSLNFYLLPGPGFTDYIPYKTITNVLESNAGNSLWISTEPCKQYKVAIESFMTREPVTDDEYEGSRDHITAEPVTTDPLPDTLVTTSMEEGANVLTWQFTDQTDCVAVINYEIDLISETGEDTNSLLAGDWEDQAAQVDISENTYFPCENYELQMKISYTTQSGNSHEKSVFRRLFRTNHLGEFAPEGTNYLAILEDTVAVTFETCDIEAVVALIDENEDSTVQEFTVTPDDVNVELEDINELMSPCVQYNVALRGLDGNEFNSEPLEPKKPQGKVAFNQTEYSTDSLEFSVDDIEENSRCQVSDYQVTCHPQEDNEEGKNLLQEFVGKSVDGSFVEVINLAPTTTYICQAMINYTGFEDNTDVIPAEEVDFFTKGFTDPPEITQGPLIQTVKAGGIVAFYCFATGDPSPNFTWKKNGKKLHYTDSRYLISDFEGGSLLRIEPVRKQREAGRYECEAENGVGDPVSVEATLEVFDDKELPKGFPQIFQNPGMKVVEKGRNAVVVCEAWGDPRPTVTWVKDTMPINIQVNSRLTLLKQGSLQIMEVEETDQGKYECVASNSVGTEYSYSARLYVRVPRVPPHFTIMPEPKYEVKNGDDLNITCMAVGNPMPFVKWKEGHKSITAENKVSIGKNVLELTDIGSTSNYTCMAASKLGIIETHTIVKVQALPRPPSNVRVTDVSSTSVRLSWSYDRDVASEVQYYVIQYKPKAASWDYKEISGAITNFYDIRGLSPYTEYEFGVLAVNNVGRGPKSIPVMAVTGETRPGSSPRNVQVRPLSSSTMVIQWDEPQDQNGLVTGYKVYYTVNTQLPLSQWESQFVDNNNLTTISDLTPHSIYTIRVEAYTSIGPGPLSIPVQVKTQQRVPSQPSNLRSIEVGSTSIRLKWEQPAHSGQNITSYELYWNDTFTDNKFSNHKSLSNSSVTEHTLENLYPNTLYHIWVAAKSGRGEGASTPVLATRTDQYGPGSSPRNVQVRPLSNSTMAIQWDEPQDQNGLVTGYKVYYTVNPQLPLSQWESQFVDNNKLTTISDLTPHTIYTIRVEAYTIIGLSSPVQVKTQQGVPSQPSNLRSIEVGSTSITRRFSKPKNGH